MKKFFVLILFLSTLHGMGQDLDTSSDERRWNMFTYDMGNIIKSMGYSYSRPLHWQGKQWLNFGEVVAGTGVLYMIDDDTSRFIRNQQTSVPKILREYGELYGNPENN
ncbi:MAG: phosphatase PAP2 family protein, partial [Flavobacteriales bacterium]